MSEHHEAGRRAERHAWTVVLSSLAAVLVAGLTVLAVGCRKEADPAGEENVVVLYCSADQEVSEPIVAEFQRRTGIKVQARYDTEAAKTVGLVQRLRAEAGRPVADVFWSNEVFHTIRLAREGLLQPYDFAGKAAWPPQFVGEKGLWHGFAPRARVVVYNTSRVGEDEAPQRIEDLLEAKWKGRMVMAEPQFGTTGGHVASWFVLYGPERAKEMLRTLKANEVRLVAGNSTVVRMVAQGQADVGLTDTDDVYSGQRNGWPVAMKFLRHGDGGPLAIPNSVALIAGAPHEAAARRLVEYLLSEDVEAALAASDAHNTPVHPSVAARFPQYAIADPLNVNYGDVAEAVPDAIAAAGEIFE
ncbi:MAG: extracellular solute-binding protein [Planctomycetes bacterium]|nr:extracellular solute-binding protein [Planctomycetota bacterium]